MSAQQERESTEEEKKYFEVVVFGKADKRRVLPVMLYRWHRISCLTSLRTTIRERDTPVRVSVGNMSMREALLLAPGS